MLLGICWDHGNDVSALLLLIHPAQVTTSPLFGEADVQFLQEKWPFPRYALHYEPQGSQSIRFWCWLVFYGIMEMMYQHCCCPFILHNLPLHPFLARRTYKIWKRNGRFRGTLFIMNPKEANVLGFDAGWYLLRSWKWCISTVVAPPSSESNHFTSFWWPPRLIVLCNRVPIAARETFVK